jgi:LacI family transcriptional regulator
MGRSDDPPRLSDVARIARVSLATASRTLSDPGLVHPEKRERVEAAVAKLGYVPHGAARALASRRSRTIGVVIPTLDNPIFASSVQSMQARLAEDGYTLLLGSHEYDLALEARQVATLVERGVDGIVLVGADHAPAVYAQLDRAGLPYELTWTLDGGKFHHCLGFSNRAAAAEVTRHLIALGHRRFAMVSGHTTANDRARERVAGVRETLEAHKLHLPAKLVVETEFSVRHARASLARILQAAPDVTALVCGNDILALGVLMEAAARGIAVPASLSVTGFDDIDFAREWTPALTSVRLPVSGIGRRAAARMLARLDEVPTERIEKVQVRLIERESSGPAPKTPVRKAGRGRAI